MPASGKFFNAGRNASKASSFDYGYDFGSQRMSTQTGYAWEYNSADWSINRSSSSLRQTGGGSSDDLNEAADRLYDAIRASDTDVNAISINTGIKPQDIQKVKDHLFYEEHLLDSYVHLGVEPEFRRFDSVLEQAEAWQRLESGSHFKEDIIWLRHEAAESWYMRKHNAGYLESHKAAEKKWTGNPWGKQ